MKTISSRKGLFIARFFPLAALLLIVFFACRKPDDPHKDKKPSSFSALVIDKWMTLQLRLMRNATGIPNHAFSRYYAYTGIAALESVTPGLPAHMQWTGRWNGLTGLPQAAHHNEYYWPASVNAALAEMARSLFSAAAATDKAAIDSLEDALNVSFLATQESERITTSNNFGKAVATAVFNWSEGDGYKSANDAYTIPVGEGLWEKTPPAFANPITPYWGNIRPVVKGSLENVQPPPPPAFSTDPPSSFYQMAKQVYDVSQTLTDAQKAMALFWRDVPGATSPGHWLSILQQTVAQTDAPLDKAALAYALTGAAICDGLISCWQTKYKYNTVRPVTYIRNVLGDTAWTSLLTTPAYPEYSSAHAILSAAAAEAFERLFGNVGAFTDHTYDYLGFAPRTYASFTAIGEEAGKSRLYAGIHYQFGIDAGIIQGRKVTSNIFSGNDKP